jgi:hypothetical protein
MFRCERCKTRFSNQEARTLEYCPLCQEEGEQASLVLKIFIGPFTGQVERARQAARVLAPKLPAPAGRSTDTSEGNSASS